MKVIVQNIHYKFSEKIYECAIGVYVTFAAWRILMNFSHVLVKFTQHTRVTIVQGFNGETIQQSRGL